MGIICRGMRRLLGGKRPWPITMQAAGLLSQHCLRGLGKIIKVSVAIPSPWAEYEPGTNSQTCYRLTNLLEGSLYMTSAHDSYLKVQHH
jgi:hypothetical protein